MTLQQLEYFLAAAEAGSVTEAAQNIPVAQSSVSAAIAQLEAALGVQLLIRKAKPTLIADESPRKRCQRISEAS